MDTPVAASVGLSRAGTLDVKFVVNEATFDGNDHMLEKAGSMA